MEAKLLYFMISLFQGIDFVSRSEESLHNYKWLQQNTIDNAENIEYVRT